MSVVLRSLLKDPRVARPFSRALRRYDDDWFLDDWPARKVRRVSPQYTHPALLMDEMSRQMADAVNRMQEFAEDLDTLDEIVGRTMLDAHHDERPNSRPNGHHKRRRAETIVKRTENGGLQLALDVGSFKPEELKIKLVDDNLVVEALSESSGEDSYQRNQFKRWFKLPVDCKLEEIRSKLTHDNKLLIDLPTSKPIEQNKTRSIPIEMEKESSQKKQVDSESAAANSGSGSGAATSQEGVKK